MRNKIALISGARAQDSSYMAELLLEKGYKVVAFERQSSSPDYSNIQHLFSNPNYILEQADITDLGSVSRLVKQYQPNEFYNFAAMSSVAASWNQPMSTFEINITGVCNCLEAVKLESPATKFFQASSSEVYAGSNVEVFNEDTPTSPMSPYGVSKQAAESLVKMYRDSYGLFACFARTTNHDSKRRPVNFVTRKITSHIGRMYNIVERSIPDVRANAVVDIPSFVDRFNLLLEKKVIEPIHLGNISIKKDFLHAGDVVRGIHMMMQKGRPHDYLLCGGHCRSIEEFLISAFSFIGISDWSKAVVIDPKFYRPMDAKISCGDYSKAKLELGWSPLVPFDDLVSEMVSHDIKINRNAV